MRIISGKWRGSRLVDVGDGDKESHLRPSSDRLRETLFNILNQEKYQFAPANRRILDLFAGTGALGLEALSRGGAFACFVDNGLRAQNLILANIQKLDAGGQAKLVTQNALDLGVCRTMPFDLVFLDPPYGKMLGEKAILNACEKGWLSQDALIISEDETPNTQWKNLHLQDTRKIGRSFLQFLTLVPVSES